MTEKLSFLAKLRVLLSFNWLIMKIRVAHFFCQILTFLGLKLVILSNFSLFGPCFLWEGVQKIFSPKFVSFSVYIHKWFQKKLFEKFFIFGWNFIPILVKPKNTIHKSFLLKLEMYYLLLKNSFSKKSSQ